MQGAARTVRRYIILLRAFCVRSVCVCAAAKVAKCGVMDNILSFAAFKNQKELKKSDGTKRSRLTGVPLLLALPPLIACCLCLLCCVCRSGRCLQPLAISLSEPARRSRPCCPAARSACLLQAWRSCRTPTMLARATAPSARSS